MKVKFLAPVLLTGLVAFTSCSKDDNKTPTPTPPTPQNTVKEVKNLNASDEQKWVYFSFETGTIVEVTNPKTTDNWDIAFNRYHVKTNSGTSGKGQGGAVRTEGKDFAALKTAPTTGYLADIEKEVSSFAGGKGGNQKISLAPALDPGHGEGFWNMVKPNILLGMIKKERPEFDKLPEVAQKALVAQLTPVLSPVLDKRIKPTLVHNNGWLTMDYKQGAQGPTYSYNNWVYVVKTAAGKYAKIQLTDYKNAKNQTGFITFKYLVF